ncbi:long-chain-fatty-acid--CoA ligase [Cryptosporangium aurantiacum]|uniref:Acyl-CoA synthetase (AMP-forming)/AMP-acid ligase II n=1 Tax=Cryptosporangium aurantiacum TaxID=134849 RepID=A0A1M7K7G1_9ACTN|nr:long-chain-fatty-acid--CoA ligase [Cryptosporangium aurantiacum]SHM61144.1 Acyl-CoA synthetase (AMP-forming)/AMP-acid ligase II [Cryptosporangium aurantiacum]
MDLEFRVADVPRQHARERGDHPAVSDGVRSLTYAELDARSTRIANALRADGVVPGDRIAVLDKNSVEIAEILLGAVKAGAVLIPLNWRLTARELSAVLRDAGATVLLAHPEFAATAEQVAVEVGTIVKAIQLGGDYEKWLDAASGEDDGWRGDLDTVVFQLYTSGTTGKPKGVLTTNRTLSVAESGPAESWGIDADSVSLVAMPMFHIGGLGYLLVGLVFGAHNVVVRELVPQPLLDLIVEKRVTNTFLVPAVIGMLVTLPGAADRDYSALRSIAYGASPITPALLRRALATFGRPLFQLYGLTETQGAIVQLDAADHDPDGPRAHLLRAAGKPYPWVELRIVDPATGADVPTGTPGEILCRSVVNTPGYHNQPDTTAALLDADGWLHTGDIGSLDAEGYLTISDRLKDMIITGGENVFPAEVEAVLADHPDVAGVAVVGRPDPTWGEAVVAVVVPQPGSTPDPDGLVAFARERLAGYKLPKSVDYVDALPLGPTGKVLKRELRSR